METFKIIKNESTFLYDFVLRNGLQIKVDFLSTVQFACSTGVIDVPKFEIFDTDKNNITRNVLGNYFTSSTASPTNKPAERANDIIRYCTGLNHEALDSFTLENVAQNAKNRRNAKLLQ